MSSTIAAMQKMNAEMEANNLAIQKESHRAALEKSRHDGIMSVINKI
ncbi:MAG: hypothetical protein M3Y59_05600 [Myxococcota bacterium]|nr:hypothetical protein [Myxococcota bacterium]MDQ3263121.1 hypothetical protein [Myxococcota bacterium]